MNIVAIFDASSLLFTSLALAIILAGRAKRQAPAPLNILLGLIALNILLSLSNTLEWSGITSRFDSLEDFIMVLQPVLWGFFLYAFINANITAELKRVLRERETLLREIHHRVKNNLVTLYSLVDLQQTALTGRENVAEVLGDTKRRIQAMGEVHQMLYQSKNFSEINAEKYTESLIGEMKTTYFADKKEIIITSDIEAVMLNIGTAIPCGLIINELLANSFTHAFPKKEAGHIHVSLQKKGNILKLRVSDDGIGMSEDLFLKKHKTLGLRLVNLLSSQLDGEFSYKKDHGSIFTVVFREVPRSVMKDPFER